MPYKSPVEHRTPRNVAVEQSSAGTFTGASDSSTYSASAGVPQAHALGTPRDNVGPTFGQGNLPRQPSPLNLQPTSKE